jgi:predicted nucleic acid-binding protein
VVFADSSGLIAVFDGNDRWHPRAREAWRGLGAKRERVILSELVFAEVVTHLRRRGGFALARSVGEGIRTSRVMEIVALGRDEMDAAWREFVRNPTPQLSLCDAASFVTMRERGISRAFTFDEDFRLAGFELLP